MPADFIYFAQLLSVSDVSNNACELYCGEMNGVSHCWQYNMSKIINYKKLENCSYAGENWILIQLELTRSARLRITMLRENVLREQFSFGRFN